MDYQPNSLSVTQGGLANLGRGSLAGQTFPAKELQKPIHEKNDLIDNNLGILNESLVRLRTRLSSILTPQSPGNPTASNTSIPPRVGMSHVAERLTASNDRILEAIRFVDDLVMELEV
jgi:hypothetical protein